MVSDDSGIGSQSRSDGQTYSALFHQFNEQFNQFNGLTPSWSQPRHSFFFDLGAVTWVL